MRTKFIFTKKVFVIAKPGTGTTTLFLRKIEFFPGIGERYAKWTYYPNEAKTANILETAEMDLDDVNEPEASIVKFEITYKET